MTVPLHEHMQLYISEKSIHVVAENETFVVDRVKEKVSVLSEPIPPVKYDTSIPAHGIFGIISLVATDYLIVITGRQKVAKVLGTDVYKANSFSVIPFSNNMNIHAPSSSLPSELVLLNLVQDHLYSGNFYYTYGSYDITSRLQVQSNVQDVPLWERADDRFFWNKFLQEPLIKMTKEENIDVSKFILPVIFGFCEFKTTSINRHPLQWGLISRRDRHRAGTRYFSRGISQIGDVSNFNETEMITLIDTDTTSSFSAVATSGGNNTGSGLRGDIRASHVQIRGSVPVFWAEVNNLKYKPTLKIMDLPNTAEATRRHFDSLIQRYGDQYITNLVNSHGSEKLVKTAYEKVLRLIDNPRVHYTYFDFHRECKGLRFDRVQLLVDKMESVLEQQGYFYQDSVKNPQGPTSIQHSTIRSNCMDCLDRTNVAQSAIASHVLTKQLKQAGVLGYKESITDHKEFDSLFKNVWADNADTVSRAYSGTGALKTDYTRTGVRTKEGALQDGINSAARYVKNNFLDGKRQDAYDLVTGAWRPKKGVDAVFQDNRSPISKIMPYLLFFTFACMVGTLLVDRNPSIYNTTILAYLCICVFALTYILKNGVDYVNWPRLVPLDDIIKYKSIVSQEKQAQRVKTRKESLVEVELGREKERTD